MEKITYTDKVQGGGTTTGRWRTQDANEVKTKFNALVDDVEDLVDDLAGHDHVASDITDFNTSVDARITAQKGVANGLVPLGSDQKIAADYLPSYVDDVIEVATYAALPGTGETGKIYVTLNNNKEYRWSGSVYIELVSSPGSTDAIAEGSTNKYFTEPRVLATILTGLTAAASRVLPASTDSLLTTLGKILKYLTDLGTLAFKSSVDLSGSEATGTMAAARMPALTGDVTSSAGGVATTVAKIQGRPVVSTAPTNGQVYAWNNSTSQWELTTPSSGSGSWTAITPSATTGTGTVACGSNPLCDMIMTTTGSFTANITSTASTFIKLQMRITLGGTHTLTFQYAGTSGNVKWPGGTAPTFGTTSGTVYVVEGWSDGSVFEVTNYYAR